MKRLVLLPEGWQCTLEECPPGLFVYDGEVGMKTEYNSCDAYCDNGETFQGGARTDDERRKLLVQPVSYRWEEVDGV